MSVLNYLKKRDLNFNHCNNTARCAEHLDFKRKNRERIMKIQKKFLIIILSLLIIIGISSILISRNISTNIIKQQITNYLITTAQSRAYHIETFLDLEKEAVKRLSGSMVIKELLLSEKKEEDYLQFYLRDYHQTIKKIT